MKEKPREAIAIRWNAVLSSAVALASTGCGPASPAPASGDDPPALSGEYDSATADRESITFSDATHYSFVWRTCAASAGLCTEEGTYALNDQRDILTFTSASTGASTSIPFAVDDVGPPAGAQTQSWPVGVAPLIEPTNPPPESADPPSLVTGGRHLLDLKAKPIIVQFSSGVNVFKIKTPTAILGVRG
jgi:hypothetical protein